MAEEQATKDGKEAAEEVGKATEDKGTSDTATAISAEPKKKKNKLALLLTIIISLFIIILISVMVAQAVIITRLKVSIDKIDNIKKNTEKHVEPVDHGKNNHGTNAHDVELETPHGTGSEGSPQENPNKSIYLPINKITVNLMPDSGGNHFLQIEMTLIISKDPLKEIIKEKMPEIQSKLILLLSTQKFTLMHSEEGKKALSLDIRDSINSIVAPKAYAIYQAMAVLKKSNLDTKETKELKNMQISLPVKAVLFNSFFIQ